MGGLGLLALRLISAWLACLVVAGCLGDPTADSRTRGLEPAPGLFTDTEVFLGEYQTTGPYSNVLDRGTREALPGTIEILKSSVDGAAIQIGIVRPDVQPGVRVPVIAMASPYFHLLEADRLGEASRPRAGSTDPTTPSGIFHVAFLIDNFVPRGYAVALIAARGTSGSGGCLDYHGPTEGSDVDQAITWLGEQSWSSGSVGMVGLSYAGWLQWRVASTGNPYLKTVVPLAGMQDSFQITVRNGTGTTGGPSIPLAWRALFGNGALYSRSAVDGAQSACPEFTLGYRADAYAAATMERDPWGVLNERNLRPRIESHYNGSVLLVQGLRDTAIYPHNNYPWINGLSDTVTVKHLLGQWRHVPPDMAGPLNPSVRWDWAEILVHWFDHWLKGDHDVDLGPRVQVADSDGRWRNEDMWPPAQTTPKIFRLGAGGTLATNDALRGEVLLTPDPSRAALPIDTVNERFPARVVPDSCVGCVSFQTDPMTEDLRFAGLPQVHLSVTPEGPGGYVTAALYSVNDSASRLLTYGQMDLRFAHEGETARAVTPGQTMNAPLELEPTDAVVAEGSRLVLVLSQGGYGSSEINYLGYFRTAAPTYPVKVQLGEDQSVVRLESFTRDADAFFQAP